MPIVISESIVLVGEEALYNDNNPRIGIHNVLTASNVSSDEEDSDFPLENIASPVTYQSWKATTAATQAVQVTLGSAETVNYFALAGHNLGSTDCQIKLQSSANGADWDDVTTQRLLASDHAFLEEFEDETAAFFRLHLDPDADPPAIAVLHIGQILRCQRRLYVGHAPAVLNRMTEVSTGQSESGKYLGRVKRAQFLEGTVQLDNLTAAWYRSTFEPFVEDAETLPFFWAWRPGDYPEEIGYVWLEGDPSVNNQSAGRMSVSMTLQGVR